MYGSTQIGIVRSEDVDAAATEWTIKGLSPSTVYNVTLTPKGQLEGAWGAYSTLPPGWFLVKNLKHCDKTDVAASLSWEPVDLDMASDYQAN